MLTAAQVGCCGLIRRAISSTTPRPALRLTYFDMKGLAEPIRLALTIGDIAFEDVRVGYGDVHTLRQQGRHDCAHGAHSITVSHHRVTQKTHALGA